MRTEAINNSPVRIVYDIVYFLFNKVSIFTTEPKLFN